GAAGGRPLPAPGAGGTLPSGVLPDRSPLHGRVARPGAVAGQGRGRGGHRGADPVRLRPLRPPTRLARRFHAPTDTRRPSTRSTRREDVLNMTGKSLKGALIASAVCAMFASAAQAADKGHEKAGGEVHCAGINSCKGTGSCAGGGHGCGGQNARKGPGRAPAKSQKEGKGKGGTAAAPGEK